MSPRIRTHKPGLLAQTRREALPADENPAGDGSQRKGTLVVVPTPIGHWDDITLRALHTLQRADVIAAEHPHVTRKLLLHFQITADLYRYSGRPEQEPSLLARLDACQTLALVCDAGTPTIADPGLGLIRGALQGGHDVYSLPGAVAAVVALAASGISAHRFVFDGFPPRNRADRTTYFAGIAAERRTVVLCETGAAIHATLVDLNRYLGGQRQIALARDLTTTYERWWRGILADALILVRRQRPHGQYTLVIAGAI